MGLIKCPDCKSTISDRVETCPKCGAPLTDEDKTNAQRVVAYEQETYTPPNPQPQNIPDPRVSGMQSIANGVGNTLGCLLVGFIILVVLIVFMFVSCAP